jgi:EmrB/QacA subfamily drug resistance transporter
MLIAARAVQGVGAALMLPATISIISAAFEPHERGTAFGIWAAISGIALAAGPIIGGVIVEAARWSWIFYINIPIGLAGLAATYRYVRESRDTTADQHLDLAGLLASAGAMFGLTFALIEANAHGWGSAEIVLCFVGAGILLAAFVLIEMRARTAMLDVALFRNPAFVGANAAGLLAMCALFGFIFFMSLYLQQIRSYSAIGAGAVFLVSTGAMTLVSPFAGKLADRAGGRLPIVAGLTLFGASLVGVSLMIGANTRLWTLYPWLFLAGIGFGLVLPPATTTVVGSVPTDKSGVASGLMQAMRQLGAAIGVAIAGALMSAHLGIFTPADVGYVARFVHGLQAVLLFTGLAALAGAVLAAGLIRGRRGGMAVAEPAVTHS